MMSEHASQPNRAHAGDLDEPLSLVRGRYEVLRELGAGAGGVVYLVFDRLRRSKITLKHLWPDAADKATQLSQASLTALTRLRHPSLPTLFDWGIDEAGRAFTTEAFVEGTPGDELAGALSFAHLNRVACALGETIGLMHRAHMGHGDIKPHNTLLRVDDEGVEVSLIDFGLVFPLKAEIEGTRGTPLYMAPELLHGGSPSASTDIYALGATLYHLCYGVAPFCRLGEAHGEGEDLDGALLGRILHEKPLHPPQGWAPPTEASERRAYEALDAVIQAMMSPQRHARAEALARLPERLSEWAPRAAEDFGFFVGRKQPQEELGRWLDDTLKEPTSTRPLLVLQGPEGVGKRRLLEIVAAEARNQGVALLEVASQSGEADGLLNDLARQLLIAAPDALGDQQAALLRELSLGQDIHPDAQGGEDARRQRLLRHLIGAARRRPIAIVARGLDLSSPALSSLAMIASHLEADRTREAPCRLMVMLTFDGDLAQAGDGVDVECLRRNARLETLAPLSLDEVGHFLECVLPGEARPDDPQEVLRLTGGLPLRLVEMARSMLAASRRGERPTGQTLRRAADLEGELGRRIGRLGLAERSALSLLAIVDRPLSRGLLQELIQDHRLPMARLQEMVAEGLLVAASVGGLAEVASSRVYGLGNAALKRAIERQGWLDTPDRASLTRRFVRLLVRLRALHPEMIEAAELIEWARRAEDWPLIAAEGLEIGRHYRRQQRHGLAREALEATLEVTGRLGEPAPEALLVELVQIYIDLDEPGRAEEVGGRLVARWADAGLDPALARAFDPLTEGRDALDHPWPERLRQIPGDAASPPASDEAALRLKTLAELAMAKGQLGGRGEALERLWALLGQLDAVHCPAAWPPTMRALAKQLWQTSYKADLLASTRGLIDAPRIFDQLDRQERSELYNLLGAVLETERMPQEAIEAYEMAMFVGRQQGASPPTVPRAMANLARMLNGKGEIAMARHYLTRAAALAEREGYLAIHHSLLRTQASIHQNTGQPYAGLIAMEEAYRVSVSSGRKDMIAKVGLSLLFHYGDFGLADHARDIHARLIASEVYKGSFEPHFQYAFALLSWGEAEEAMALKARTEAAAGGKAMGTQGMLSGLLIEAEAALIGARWQDALKATGQALITLRGQSLTSFMSMTLRLNVEAHLQLGDLAEAGRRLDDLEDLSRAQELGSEVPLILHLRAQLLMATGQQAEAARALDRARAELERLLADMPEAYRKNYLRHRYRSALLDEARSLSAPERGRGADDLRQILDIVQKLHRSFERSLDELLSEVLDQMIGFTCAERGILFTIDALDEGTAEAAQAHATIIERDWDDSGGPRRFGVKVARGRGFNQQDLGEQRARASRAVISSVLARNAPVLSADAIQDMRFSQSNSVATLGMRSILAIPLRDADRINGVVYLDSQHIKQFTDGDTELLNLLGDQMGPVLARAYQREHAEAVSHMFPRIIGRSEALLEVLDGASRVASADVAVMILGETGTGKELLAQGLHALSPRAQKPFVALNCAAIPESLAEAELFGAQAGAYTGSTQHRAGYFEQASGGTIFLDEIDDLPLSSQARLLRVLEEGFIRRVGDNRDRPVDVRVIAATHWDLDKLVEQGRFRQDLLYRLNTIKLKLPALRERREDIPLLVHFFFNLFLIRHKLSMAPPSPEALKALQALPWPGTVRQLRNAIQQAMLFGDANGLSLDAIRTAAGEVKDQEQDLDPIPDAFAPAGYPASPPWPAAASQPPPQGWPHAPASPWAQPQYWPPTWPPPWAGWPPHQAPPYAQAAAPQGHPGWPAPTWAPHAQPPWPWPPGWSTPQPPAQAPAAPQSWPPPHPQGPTPQHTAPQGHPGWPAPANPREAAADASRATTSGDDASAPRATPLPIDYAAAKARHGYEVALQALQTTAGNKTAAAQLMGITRQTLYKILSRGLS